MHKIAASDREFALQPSSLRDSYPSAHRISAHAPVNLKSITQSVLEVWPNTG